MFSKNWYCKSHCLGKHLKYFTKAHLPVYLTFIYITYLISQCLCKLWEVFLCVTHWCLTVWCVMCGLCCCYHINIMSLIFQKFSFVTFSISWVFLIFDMFSSCYLINIMSLSGLREVFLLLPHHYHEFVWSLRNFLLVISSLSWVCSINVKFSWCYYVNIRMFVKP